MSQPVKKLPSHQIAHRSGRRPRLAVAASLALLFGLILALPGLLNGLGVPADSPGAVQAAADPVIAAAGDIACDPADSNFNAGKGVSGQCRQKYTSDLLVNAGLAAVLNLGDNQYYCGGYQAYLQSYDLSWGRVKDITYPSVGNHEYLTYGGTDCSITNEGAAGYFQYFGAAAGNPGEGYYSFNIGSWHLIALNSSCSGAGGCSSGTPQGQWLIADLKAHKNFCTLAFWHIPLYSSGGRASTNAQSLFQTLYDYDADLVLAAHDHTYERFAPMDANGNLDLARGIRSFVVGTGGANLTSLAALAPNSEVFQDSTFGVLKLTLRATGYDWEFVPEAGKTFRDSGSASCHGAGGDTTPPTAPTGLAAGSVTSSRVGLSWKASTDNAGIAGYEVQRNGVKVGSTTGTSYTDTSVVPLTSYTYTVTAMDTSGISSPPSNAVTVTTPAPTPTSTPTVTRTPTVTPTATLTPTPTRTPVPTLAPSVNFNDGFETASLAYWNPVAGMTVQSQVVADGSYAARASPANGSAGYARRTLAFPQRDLYYTVRFQVISQGANAVTLARILTQNGQPILSVNVNAQGLLGIRNEVTGARSTSNLAVGKGAWQWLQVHVHIENKNSLIEVGYNGVLAGDLSGPAGLANSPAGMIQIGEHVTGLSFDVAFDDVIVSPSPVIAGGPILRKFYLPLLR